MRYLSVYHLKVFALPDLVEEVLEFCLDDKGFDIVVSDDLQDGSVFEVFLGENHFNVVKAHVFDDESA